MEPGCNKYCYLRYRNLYIYPGCRSVCYYRYYGY